MNMMGRRSVGKYHCLELNDIQRGSHGKLDKRMKGREHKNGKWAGNREDGTET